MINLKREIEVLEMTQGKDWSIQLIEYIPVEVMGDCAIIVTELISGIDVAKLREFRDNQLTEYEVFHIAHKVTLATKELHGLGIMHRDLC